MIHNSFRNSGKSPEHSERLLVLKVHEERFHFSLFFQIEPFET